MRDARSLGEAIDRGERRAVARLISWAERGDPRAFEVIGDRFERTGNARVLGITGPPGSGKSTLTDVLIRDLRSRGERVGVIAVDPTSPFTGGAVLGDRVRMNEHAPDPEVFIRSMGTRGHLGGLSRATSAAIRALDLFGCQSILVETVGVGQSEVDIMQVCDCTIMVTVPGLGDEVQAIKAGVMEVGDIFVVNKADLDGAKKTARELKAMLDLNVGSWRPPVKELIAAKGEGIDQLWEEIDAYQQLSTKEGTGETRRRKQARHELVALAQWSVAERAMTSAHHRALIDELSTEVAMRRLDPYRALSRLLPELING